MNHAPLALTIAKNGRDQYEVWTLENGAQDAYVATFAYRAHAEAFCELLHALPLGYEP